MTSKHDEITTMRTLRYIMSNILLLTGERMMRVTSLLLLVYVVLRTMEFPSF